MSHLLFRILSFLFVLKGGLLLVIPLFVIAEESSTDKKNEEESTDKKKEDADQANNIKDDEKKKSKPEFRSEEHKKEILERCHMNHAPPNSDLTWQELQELRIDWEEVRTPLAEFGREYLEEVDKIQEYYKRYGVDMATEMLFRPPDSQNPGEYSQNTDENPDEYYVNTRKIDIGILNALKGKYLWPTIITYKCFLDMELNQQSVAMLSAEEVMGILSLRLAYVVCLSQKEMFDNLQGSFFIVEWSILMEMLNFRLYYYYDFARVIFPLLTLISDSVPRFNDPCIDGWNNKYGVRIPQTLHDLDLDLHETWTHLLTEAVLNREYLGECGVAMAWLSMNIAFIVAAAQDRNLAFEYIHLGQHHWAQSIKRMKAYRIKKVLPSSSEGENKVLPNSGEGKDEDLPFNWGGAGRYYNGDGSTDELLNKTNTGGALLYRAESQDTTTNLDELPYQIFEKHLTFPNELDMLKFFGSNFKIFDVLAKLDVLQGLSYLTRGDEEMTKTHLDEEMQILSGVDKEKDNRYLWDTTNEGSFPIQSLDSSSQGSSSSEGSSQLNQYKKKLSGKKRNFENSPFAAKFSSRMDIEMDVRNIKNNMDVKGSKIEGLQSLLYEYKFPKIAIIDVGAIQVQGKPHIYHKLLMQDLCFVVGFDPNENYRKSYPNMVLHPFFVGDGNLHTFYQTQNTLSSSLLKPNHAITSQYDQLHEAYKIVMSNPVQTRKLDDVLKVQQGQGYFNVDYLKLDVQGAEMMILENAQEVLSQVVMVDVEVHFRELYQNMPLFADIDMFLRKRGFYFMRFSDLSGRGLKPTRLSTSTLWGNAIYVRDIDLWFRREISAYYDGKRRDDESKIDSSDDQERLHGRNIITSSSNDYLSENHVFMLANEFNQCVNKKTSREVCNTKLKTQLKQHEAVQRHRFGVPPEGGVPEGDEGEKNINKENDYQTRPEGATGDAGATLPGLQHVNETHIPGVYSVSDTRWMDMSELMEVRKEKLIKLAIIAHEIYASMDLAMMALSKLGKYSGLAQRYYYKMVDALPTEKYIPGAGAYELTQGFRPPQRAYEIGKKPQGK